MEPKQIFELLQNGGLLALLVVLFFLGSKRWWVWGWMYKELLVERDEWKALALKGAHLADRGANQAEQSELISQILDIQAQLMSRHEPKT